MSLEGACRREWLEEAFRWCCRQRKNAPADADIWHLWFHWQEIKPELLAQLEGNRYRLSAMQVVGRGKDRLAMWSAQDALVLKWVAIRLHAVLPVHPLCEHHRGHGGGRQSVRRMDKSLREQRWSYVCRTDIQGFYGHIRRGPLLRQLKRHVSDPVLLELVRQYLHYSVERGGEFYTPRKGLCRGCALSPLLAGFCLWAMDTYFEAQQPALRYVRYMDDIVIFTRTRWLLRRAVRALNVFFASGGYRQHPQKTFIGKAERGFDWMGIQFNGSGIVGVAPRAMANHRERCRRLYEQAWRYGERETRKRVAAYVRRWTIWRKTMHIMQRATDVQPDGTRAGRITSMLATAGHRGQAPAASDTASGLKRAQTTPTALRLFTRSCLAILAWLVCATSHAESYTYTVRQASDGSINLQSGFQIMSIYSIPSSTPVTGPAITFDVLDGTGTSLGTTDGYCIYRDRPLRGIHMGIDDCAGGLRVGYIGSWRSGFVFLIGNDTTYTSTRIYQGGTGNDIFSPDPLIPSSLGGSWGQAVGLPKTLSLPNNLLGVEGGLLRLVPYHSLTGFRPGAQILAPASSGAVPGTYTGTLTYLIDNAVVNTITITVTVLPAVPTCTVTPAVSVDLGRLAQTNISTRPNALLAQQQVTMHASCRATSASDVGKVIDVQFQGPVDNGSQYHLALTNTAGATADAPYVVLLGGEPSHTDTVCTAQQRYNYSSPVVSWIGVTAQFMKGELNHTNTVLGDNNADLIYNAYLCNPSTGKAAVGQYRGTATYQASLQ